MINNLLKNFCLITFALIAPITLPAGGIQKSLNQNKFPHNTNEIILTLNTSLYSYPEINANQLLVLDVGATVSVLRNWKVSESQISPSLTCQCRKTDKGVPIFRTTNSFA